ncbi:MAG: hypothetical protein AAF526_02635 [Pseudomonadota bacterium]
MRLISLTVLVALACVEAAEARQPISVSLAECAVIYEELGRSETRKRGVTERSRKAENATEVFLTAAEEQAEAEGRADPAGFVSGWVPKHRAKWDDAFGSVLKFSENMEWVEYCGALGKDRGLLPIPD